MIVFGASGPIKKAWKSLGFLFQMHGVSGLGGVVEEVIECMKQGWVGCCCEIYVCLLGCREILHLGLRVLGVEACLY